MTVKAKTNTELTKSAWEAHNLEQLQYFRSLSLRTKLEAVQGMADVVRHFQKMRTTGKFKALSDDDKK